MKFMAQDNRKVSLIERILELNFCLRRRDEVRGVILTLPYTKLFYLCTTTCNDSEWSSFEKLPIWHF